MVLIHNNNTPNWSPLFIHFISLRNVWEDWEVSILFFELQLFVAELLQSRGFFCYDQLFIISVFPNPSNMRDI